MSPPKTNAGKRFAKFPELGMKNIAKAEIIDPRRINGIRLPRRVQVLSLESPIIGCTTKPAKGAASQK